MPIASLHRIRLPRMPAGGTIDWIGLRNANAGICVRSEGRRNKRRDYFYLDGKYLHSVQAVANSLLHFFLR